MQKVDRIPSLRWFLNRDTSLGRKIRALRMLNGHNLVFKVQVSQYSDGKHGGHLLLPDEYTMRSVKNLVSIMGLVVVPSETYRTRRAVKKWIFDPVTQQEELKWGVSPGPYTEPQVRAGECIVYNSYNVGKVWVDGVNEPLVIVRDIDILASFDRKDAANVQLSRFAMTRSKLNE